MAAQVRIKGGSKQYRVGFAVGDHAFTKEKVYRITLTEAKGDGWGRFEAYPVSGERQARTVFGSIADTVMAKGVNDLVMTRADFDALVKRLKSL